MSSLIVNIKNIKNCAFCKNWYDPTNSAITPKAPSIGLWEIKDVNEKRMCLKKNIEMSGIAFCIADYERKI